MQNQESIYSQEKPTPAEQSYPLINHPQRLNFQKQLVRETIHFPSEKRMTLQECKIEQQQWHIRQIQKLKKKQKQEIENLSTSSKPETQSTFFDHAVCIGGNPCFEICCYKNCNKSAIVCNKMECICRIEHEQQFPDSDEICTRIDPKFLLKKMQSPNNREQQISRQFEKMRQIVSRNFLEFALSMKKIEDKALASLMVLEQKTKRQKNVDFFNKPEMTPEEKWFMDIINQNNEKLEFGELRYLKEMTGKKISEVRSSITRKKTQSENPLGAMCEQLSDTFNTQFPVMLKRFQEIEKLIANLGEKKPTKTNNPYQNYFNSLPNKPPELKKAISTHLIEEQSFSLSNPIVNVQPPILLNTGKIPTLVQKLFCTNKGGEVKKQQPSVMNPQKYEKPPHYNSQRNLSKIIQSNRHAESVFKLFEDVYIDTSEKNTINNMQQKPLMQLLYRASEQSFSIPKFHKHCDEKSQTVIFIRTQGGQIIGGYTPSFWNMARNKKESSRKPDYSFETFIFSVSTESKFKMTDGREVIDSPDRKGIGFCGKPDSDAFDLYIANRANKQGDSYALYANNFENAKYTKKDPKSFMMFHGEKIANFMISEWEVYQIWAPVRM